MRKECPAIIDGDLEFLLDDHPEIIMYLRRCARQSLLIIANYSGKEVCLALPEKLKSNQWKRYLTNLKNTVPVLEVGRKMQPWEVEIYELSR